MSIRIIADSCCDFTAEMKEQIRPLQAPLIVSIPDGPEYVDDGTVDIMQLLRDLASSERTARSTCPSPEAYASLMRQCDECFVITLSSKLSGSYNAAQLGRSIVLEESPEKKIHLLDSLSASAAETQIALYVHEQIEKGLSFEEIASLADAFIRRLHTFFVLEDLGNLLKNGRMAFVAGRIVNMIKLCPVMGENGEGNIKLVAPSLGIERSLRKLVEIVAHYTSNAKDRSVRLVLCFCNCLPRAEKLKQRLLSKCPALGEVILIPTGALSTMYANDGGVIITF